MCRKDGRKANNDKEEKGAALVSRLKDFLRLLRKSQAALRSKMSNGPARQIAAGGSCGDFEGIAGISGGRVGWVGGRRRRRRRKGEGAAPHPTFPTSSSRQTPDRLSAYSSFAVRRSPVLPFSVCRLPLAVRASFLDTHSQRNFLLSDKQLPPSGLIAGQLNKSSARIFGSGRLLATAQVSPGLLRRSCRATSVQESGRVAHPPEAG
jgi:hypothetical protein